MLYYLLLILGITAVIGEITFIFFWIYPRLQHKKEKTQDYTPKTCVIVPCKGVTTDFKGNIESICSQDYPNYKVIFVIDSKKDKAYPILKELTSKKSYAKIEFSDVLQGCSGKISALLKGVEKADDVEVFVFADSDIKPHNKWLYFLVNKLNDKRIGATTGFRWYFPHDKTSYLISTWNMASIVGLFYSASNYLWGGSTAIRKKLFDELNVKSKWKNGLSDDLILTEILKNNKYKIKFVPQSVVESPTDEKINTFIKWGSRQLTWMRWYYPSLWIISFFGFIGAKFLTVIGFILPLVGYTLPAILFISMIFLEMIYGYVGFTTMRKFMCYPRNKFRSVAPYILLMPVVFFLLAYNTFISTFKKEIQWGGRAYKKSEVIKK
jgi:ceramide glucosyltransferase